MKITKIYNDAKDKNVAKTVLFYASNDESKTLYYEPSLENEVSKEDLVDFFLKGLVIQAVENGECVGEYSMPTTLGEEQSGGSVEPVILYIREYRKNGTKYGSLLHTIDTSELSNTEAVQYALTKEEFKSILHSNAPIIMIEVYSDNSGIAYYPYVEDSYETKYYQINQVVNTIEYMHETGNINKI